MAPNKIKMLFAAVMFLIDNFYTFFFILGIIFEIVPEGCHSVAQNAASIVENWSVLNKPQLNPDKCKEL